VVCAAAVQAEEYYDHPLIGRYEGSSATHQESSRLDRYVLGSAPQQTAPWERPERLRAGS